MAKLDNYNVIVSIMELLHDYIKILKNDKKSMF